jgi:PAS domain S-box-containing protein
MDGLNGRRLDQAFRDAAGGVFVLETDGRIVLWNRTAERILGYTARDAIGRLSCELLVSGDKRGNRLCYRGCHVMTLVKTDEPVQNFDLFTRTRAGQPAWLNISVLTIPAGGRNGSLAVHMFRDVTAAKEPPAAANGSLTPREFELLRLTAAGMNTKAAAERLQISPATIRNHMQNIFGKLRVHSRLEAVAYATRHRLL